MSKAKKKEEDNESLTRIAIVDSNKCKPRKCKQECKRNCPVVRMGKLCIEVTSASKIAFISEELCIGCGICVKKCPFEAINIINLPKNLEKETTHRYGPNSFKLHRLPMPRPGYVLGLVGTNGIGKSTALKVLAGKLKPNLGRFDKPPDWKEILVHFRGSELQNFFTKVVEDNIKAVIKPQYVDHIPRTVQGNVREILSKRDERKIMDQMCEELELTAVLDRNIENLSGGELQRFAIALTCVQEADVYMFDEPSSYLDVKQRLQAARVIRGLCAKEKYVVVVEHDLSVLDYLSDFVCCLYGKPGAYGVVSMPFTVREGINIFLAGYVPTENLRFRTEELTFKVAENVQDNELEMKRHHSYTYPKMTKTLGDFKLVVEKGSFTESQIVVMLGQNGTGKTTFIRMLAGLLEPDGGGDIPKLNVSYKPQKIAPKFEGTVRQLLHSKIPQSYVHPQFVADVMKPMMIDEVIDQEVKNLSGGELQRVALALALGKPADIYLIDEPSAYLDSEQRIVAAKVIKRFILHSKKTAFIVEHDFIMATYLADLVIVYTGIPAKAATANSPQPLLSGMNAFLKDLGITFRRDPSNHRPRINKLNSVKDTEQKKAGTYFYLDTEDDDEEEGNKRAARKGAKFAKQKAPEPGSTPAEESGSDSDEGEKKKPKPKEREKGGAKNRMPEGSRPAPKKGSAGKDGEEVHADSAPAKKKKAPAKEKPKAAAEPSGEEEAAELDLPEAGDGDDEPDLQKLEEEKEKAKKGKGSGKKQAGGEGKDKAGSKKDKQDKAADSKSDKSSDDAPKASPKKEKAAEKKGSGKKAKAAESGDEEGSDKEEKDDASSEQSKPNKEKPKKSAEKKKPAKDADEPDSESALVAAAAKKGSKGGSKKAEVEEESDGDEEEDLQKPKKKKSEGKKDEKAKSGSKGAQPKKGSKGVDPQEEEDNSRKRKIKKPKSGPGNNSED